MMGCSSCKKLTCTGNALLNATPDASNEETNGYVTMSEDVTEVDGDRSFYWDKRCWTYVGVRFDPDKGLHYYFWSTTSAPCRWIRCYIPVDMDEYQAKLKKKWSKLYMKNGEVRVVYFDKKNNVITPKRPKGLTGNDLKNSKFMTFWLYMAARETEFNAAYGKNSKTYVDYDADGIPDEVMETQFRKEITYDSNTDTYITKWIDIDDFELNTGVPFDEDEYNRTVKFFKKHPYNIDQTGKAYMI